MSLLRRVGRLGRTARYALVAVAAFAIGSATVASASIAGIPVGSLFYLPMINGTATTPCSTTGANTTTCTAIVDSNGNLHVSGTSTITGSVGVSNFPDTQKVSGTVNVGNLPPTQTVDGTVNVGNLPAKQEVTGIVNVGNLPANQNVNIVGGSAAGAPPAANRVVQLSENVRPHSFVFVDVNLKVTFMMIQGCDSYRIFLSGPGLGNDFDVTTPGNLAFPIPMDVTLVEISNSNPLSACDAHSSLIGY